MSAILVLEDKDCLILLAGVPEVVEEFSLGWLVEGEGGVSVLRIVGIRAENVFFALKLGACAAISVKKAKAMLDIFAEVDWRLSSNLDFNGERILTGLFRALKPLAKLVDVSHCDLVRAHIMNTANLSHEVDPAYDDQDEDQHGVEEGQNGSVDRHALVVDACPDAVERARPYHFGEQRDGDVLRLGLLFFFLFFFISLSVHEPSWIHRVG